MGLVNMIAKFKRPVEPAIDWATRRVELQQWMLDKAIEHLDASDRLEAVLVLEDTKANRRMVKRIGAKAIFAKKFDGSLERAENTLNKRIEKQLKLSADASEAANSYIPSLNDYQFQLYWEQKGREWNAGKLNYFWTQE